MSNIDLTGKYAVAKLPDAKAAILVKLKVKKNGDIYGITQNNLAGDDPTSTFLALENILAVFPNKNIAAGKAYNIKLEPFYKAAKVTPWGNIFYYRELADAEEKALRRSLTNVATKFLQANNLRYVLPMELEIRPNYGKIQGYALMSKKNTDPTICLCPTSFFSDQNNPELQKTIIHELGEVFWAKYVSDKIKHRWIKLYHSYVTIEELDTDDLKSSLSDFVSAASSVASYKKTLEGKPRETFLAAIDFIKNKHKLQPKHLDIMIAQGNDLNSIWPTSRLHLSEIKQVVTEYAKKDPKEFFCEAFAFYGTKQELPVKLSKLCKKTIKAIKPK